MGFEENASLCATVAATSTITQRETGHPRRIIHKLCDMMGYYLDAVVVFLEALAQIGFMEQANLHYGS